MTHLMATLDNALDHIAPAYYEEHQDLALLMAKPQLIGSQTPEDE